MNSKTQGELHYIYDLTLALVKAKTKPTDLVWSFLSMLSVSMALTEILLNTGE